jgi:tetratricopeptide (TPR) repeat protein
MSSESELMRVYPNTKERNRLSRALALAAATAGLWTAGPALGQTTAAPVAPSGEQLLQEELNNPTTDGGMRVRRAVPVDRSGEPTPMPSEAVPPPAYPAEAPAEIVAPRAIPVERSSTPGSSVPPPAIPPMAEPVTPRSVPAPAPAPAPVTPPPAPAPQVQPPSQPPATQAAAPEAPAAPRAEPVSSSSGPGAAALAAADGFYAREMWDVARTKYADYLSNPEYRSDPGRQTALYRLAETCLRLERKDQAREFYWQLIKEFRITGGPFVGPAAYRLADFSYKEENYASAAGLFELAADKLEQPNLALSSRYYQARCLEKTGRRTEASNAYQKVIAATGDNPYKEIAELSMARIQVEFGQKDKALEAYVGLIQRSTKPEVRSEATVQAGLLAAELGKTDQAMEYLSRAIEDSEQAKWKPQAVVVLMRVLSAGNRFKEVIETYKKYGSSIAIGDRPEMLNLAATAYRREGEYDKATRMLQEVFENYPNSSQAGEAEYQYLLGLYQAKEDGLAKRVDTFLSKYPTGPQADRAALLKAEFLFSKEKYKEAAEAYQRVVKSNLSAEIKAEGIYRQAWCYWELKDMTQAVLKFNQFIGNYPKHPLVVKALAQRALAYTQNKQYELALGDFDRIVRQFPDAAAEREIALQKKGLIQRQLGKNEDMIVTFQLLLKDYPQTTFAAEAYWWIGQGSYDIRDFKSTVDAMRKARELDATKYEERASIFVMLALYNLEDINELAKEVSEYSKKERQLRVPDEVVLWMGRKFFAENKYAEAAKFLDLAVASPSFDPASDIPLYLGQARAQLNEFEPAVAAFDKYLAAHPAPQEKVRGLMEKSRALIGLKKFDEAAAAAKEVTEIYQDGLTNAKALILLGDVEFARKNYGDAGKMYERVSLLFQDPEITPQALKKAAEAYEKAGNATKAQEMKSNLLKYYPDFVAP